MKEKEMQLAHLREQIDILDRQLVELFCARMALCADIAAVKGEAGLPVLDEQRQQQKLDAVAALAPQHAQALRQLYSEIFALSRAYQAQLLEREES